MLSLVALALLGTLTGCVAVAEGKAVKGNAGPGGISFRIDPPSAFDQLEEQLKEAKDALIEIYNDPAAFELNYPYSKGFSTAAIVSYIQALIADIAQMKRDLISSGQV